MEYRVVLVGRPSGIGKSCLAVRFVSGTYKEVYDPNIEDTYRRMIEVNGQPKLIEFIDTAGEEEYSTLTNNYLRGGMGYLIAFAITVENTLQYVKRILNDIEDLTGGLHPPIVLVALKCDIEENRKISTLDIEKFANEINCPFFETSAKIPFNITEPFTQICRDIDTARNGPQTTEKNKQQCGIA